MTTTMKLAGNIVKGDTILWDGEPGTVLEAEPCEIAGVPHMEVLVTSDTATAAAVWNVGDIVLMWRDPAESGRL